MAQNHSIAVAADQREKALDSRLGERRHIAPAKEEVKTVPRKEKEVEKKKRRFRPSASEGEKGGIKSASSHQFLQDQRERRWGVRLYGTREEEEGGARFSS